MIDLGILYAVKEGDFIRRLGLTASMQEIAVESGMYIVNDLENSCIEYCHIDSAQFGVN